MGGSRELDYKLKLNFIIKRGGQMKIKSKILRNGMKIGVIGISGKGKSTLLNHLVDQKTANDLKDLIGPKQKENENSGKTKNPVRYYISRDQKECVCRVSRLDIESKEVIEEEINIATATQFAQSTQKCTITINAFPSTEFYEIMEQYNLNELEFVDTQGLLDSIDQDSETIVPLEIKECAVLLYLYDESDQGVRGDYIKRYRNFLNGISDKPLIFLETGVQWQVEEQSDIEHAHEQLNKKDKNYSKSAQEIRNRYSILTGNDQYKNKETFLLTSILSEAQSSVNYYEVKLPKKMEDNFALCVRICAAHVMKEIFDRLTNIIDNIQNEFNKAKGKYDHSVGFKGCYGLLSDIFVYKYQRINYETYAKILRYGRHNIHRFECALNSFQKGKLFSVSLDKIQKEIHTEYGYHCIYETYQNQDILDCMQLLLDLYKYYLSNIKVSGDKLSKAIQVYLTESVSSDYMCRDTGYSIPILEEKIFIHCLEKLQNWIGDLPVETVVYKNYKNMDVPYTNKESILIRSGNIVGSTTSLISKLDYFCMCLNDEMYDLASEALANCAKDIMNS